MRIVFIAYLHGFGGAERQNILLANEMVGKGHEVFLISLCANNICYKIDERVNCIHIPDEGKGIFVQVNRYKKLYQMLKEIVPDLTVSFWFQSAYFTALMKKSVVGKVIYAERADPGDSEYDGILGVVRKLVLPLIDGFVFQSKGAQSFFDKKVQERSIVISNPVFVKKEDYPVVDKRRKSVVSVGRLGPQKNQKLLISAFKLIENDFPQYIVELYGEGELEAELRMHIKELDLEKRVFLRGVTEKVHEAIYDASLFVLTSDYEGLPNALIEAMALGLPCISTDCRPGGAREIINEEEDGIIVPLGDVEQLADAMAYMLGNREVAEKFGKAAAKNIKRLQKETIYNNWEKYFENIVNKKELK